MSTRFFALKNTLLALLAAVCLSSGTRAADDSAKPAAGAAPTTDTYPLTKCLISGEKLGEMGKPIIKHYEGREVRFCCAACPPMFEEHLKENLKKMDDEVIKAQLPTYPLETCVVSGEKLGGDMGDPINYVYKGRELVRFCCKSCISKFEKDPKPFLSKIETARKAKATQSKIDGSATTSTH